MLSRRTTRRYFLFRPDADREMEELFWYCLAVAAAKHGVLVHSVILMSNHVHVIITDVEGVLPDFLHDFHRMLANATKVLRGWPEEVFNKCQTSCVELITDEAVVEKMGYVIGNGPHSGLVRYANDWPGAHTRVSDVGRRVVRARRPAHWFDETNAQWPAEVELPILMPERLIEAYGSAEAAREAIAAEVREIERNYPNRYRVSSDPMPGGSGVEGCPAPGQCSEWRAAAAAHSNPSAPTGYDTVWRGRGDNPHPRRGGSGDQMEPCPTCQENASDLDNHAQGN